MSRFAATALMLLGTALATPAFAQSPPPLAYAQPLAPPAVRAVQDKLHQAGAYGGTVDGVWGQDSQTALEQFQQGHNLQVTGQINPATASALGLDPAQLLQLAAAQAPTLAHLGADAIRNIQNRLRTLGFYNGGSDGLLGAATQDAVTRLQQNRGLQPTGRLDAQTVSAMGLDPNNPAAPAH